VSAKVKAVIIKAVKQTNLEEAILKATKMMNEYDIGSVVVTKEGQAVGIVTERDTLKSLVSKRKDSAEPNCMKLCQNH